MSMTEQTVGVPMEDLIPGPPPPFSATLGPSATVQPSCGNDALNGPSLPSGLNYQQALESLPTLVGGPNERFFANDDPSAFLHRELNLDRLNRIHSHLWLAGSSIPAHPLHWYQLMGYEILGAQQMDLHLTKTRGSPQRLMVKPLPYWIFSHEFWSKHICREDWLWRSAAGLFSSYAWLITTSLDFEIAHDLTLLPKSITWSEWKLFVSSCFGDHVDINTLHQVNMRYQFGELRIDRLNLIYRIGYFKTHFLRGYLHGYHTYTPFFERKFAWALIPFGVFLTVILSSMQVGISLPALGTDPTFLDASNGIVIFSMICVLVVVSSVVVYQVFIFFMLVVKAITFVNLEQERRIRHPRSREWENA